jgi:ABC-2 type transport system ATP-binding protein
MSGAVLEVCDLFKTYRIGFMRRRIEAVRGISFEVMPGEVFGLLGPNGAGKTSIIKTALRLIYPTKGEVKLFGTASWDRGAMRRIGYLPENPYVYQYLRADEFLDLCGRLTDLSSTARKTRTTELIERVGLTHALDRPIGKFSKGMMQRVGLAQALLHDPEFLILDEPMSGLDPIGRKQVREIILEEHHRGKTIVFTSHILTDVEMLCDRVVIINEGQVSAQGDLDSLLAHGERRVEVTLANAGDELLANLKERATSFSRKNRGCTAVISGDASSLLRELSESGAEVIQIRPVRESLEDLFVRRTDTSLQDLPAVRPQGGPKSAVSSGKETKTSEGPP